MLQVAEAQQIVLEHTVQLPAAQASLAPNVLGSVLADAVVMIERTELLDERHVQIRDKPPMPGHNILARGREMRQGETVLQLGTVLDPASLGVLASVGRTSVTVYPAPQVAVLATGDE